MGIWWVGTLLLSLSLFLSRISHIALIDVVNATATISFGNGLCIISVLHSLDLSSSFSGVPPQQLVTGVAVGGRLTKVFYDARPMKADDDFISVFQVLCAPHYLRAERNVVQVWLFLFC